MSKPSQRRMRATHGPTCGVADSLDEAKAAFRAAGERPLSEGGPDVIAQIVL
jgi:hypothetical protein